MPELPEVETTRRGIRPYLEGRRIERVVVRDRRLRWPVPTRLTRALPGEKVQSVERRAKYLLMRFSGGTVISHLGMSGSFRIVRTGEAPEKHDHVDLELEGNKTLRFRDPRRFGCMLWTTKDPHQHQLLQDLGPEPLGDEFTADHLHAKSRGRSVAVKSFLMDAKVVVGVGNIYANEALFRSGIHPTRRAGRVSKQRYAALVEAVRDVLQASLRAGGTTLRDFASAHGSPGYFVVQLSVYDREGQPCVQCSQPIRCQRVSQRSTYYCPRCQR